METIKNGEIVEDDLVHLDDDAELPEEGRVTVSLSRWKEYRFDLIARGDVGVRLDGTDELDDIVDDLEHFATVALEFPEFTDGRCYTYARWLRERHGYEGELRATGDVLRDQLFFMTRCGFDVLEVRPDKDIEDALEGLDELSVTYQPAADGRPPIYHQYESARAEAAE